jgi:hypothetical protein
MIPDLHGRLALAHIHTREKSSGGKEKRCRGAKAAKHTSFHWEREVTSSMLGRLQLFLALKEGEEHGRLALSRLHIKQGNEADEHGNMATIS